MIFSETNIITHSLAKLMNQEVIIGLMFIAALGYLVNLFWNRTRKPSSGCGENCNSCSVIDEIEKMKGPLP